MMNLWNWWLLLRVCSSVSSAVHLKQFHGRRRFLYLHAFGQTHCTSMQGLLDQELSSLGLFSRVVLGIWCLCVAPQLARLYELRDWPQDREAGTDFLEDGFDMWLTEFFLPAAGRAIKKRRKLKA